MRVYSESEYLQLAGIQHFAFCKRQWALIHLEQEWQENVRTIEGNILHEKAHNDKLVEKRGNTLITRGLEVSSPEIGIYGICDVVEFHKDEDGIPLIHFEGDWIPEPIEYKRGKPKVEDVDRLQLCAQAVCLEHVFGCSITQGALYYHEIKHREVIDINDELREKLNIIINEMHTYFYKSYTPKAVLQKQCSSCSLYDICVPSLPQVDSAKAYIEKHLEEK